MIRPLFFFTHCPLHPATSGLARRCVELLQSYRAAGFTVTLLTVEHDPSNPHWDAEAIAHFESQVVERVLVYNFTKFDRIFIRNLNRYYRYRNRIPPLNSPTHTPPGMRRWFKNNLRRSRPEVAVIVYAMWDGLRKTIPKGMQVRTVMETIDLTSLNQRMWWALEKRLPPYSIEVDQDVLDENFFTRLRLAPSEEEFGIYDRYDDTISISKPEADVISRQTKRTRVHCIPMSMPVVECRNTYNSAAIFPTGPNPFNLQACYYLTRRVIPDARKQQPDFQVNITGSCSKMAEKIPGVTLRGFVPNLTELYANASFLICPLIGGTGLIVKVVEAMAHGVAPLILSVVRDRTPINHGVDGLIANNCEEFLAWAMELWSDRALCRKLGEAARERVRQEFSPQRLVSQLTAIFDRSPITPIRRHSIAKT